MSFLLPHETAECVFKVAPMFKLHHVSKILGMRAPSDVCEKIAKGVHHVRHMLMVLLNVVLSYFIMLVAMT